MNLLLADHLIHVDPMYDYLTEYCKAYCVNGEENSPVFSITTCEADIEEERARSDAYHLAHEMIPRDFRPDYLETLSVYRKIAEKMPELSTLLIHGSALSIDKKGILFIAKSGTGKSTHARLWRDSFSDRVTMINDDKPLIRVTEEEVRIYGTPWDGKHRLSTNTSVPLRAIVILERGEQNRIEQISYQEAYVSLVKQTYRPQTAVHVHETLSLLDLLAKQVQFYRLSCNMEQEAALVAYRGIIKE